MPIYLELNLGLKRNKSNLSLHRNHISLNKVTISIQSDGKNKFDERRSFHPALISKTLEPYLEIYYSHISEYLIPFNQQSNLPTSNISPIRPKKIIPSAFYTSELLYNIQNHFWLQITIYNIFIGEKPSTIPIS